MFDMEGVGILLSRGVDISALFWGMKKIIVEREYKKKFKTHTKHNIHTSFDLYWERKEELSYDHWGYPYTETLSKPYYQIYKANKTTKG
jgi:hypothetical protein